MKCTQDNKKPYLTQTMQLQSVGGGLVLLLVAISVSHVTAVDNFGCPLPWLPFEDKCYKFEHFADTLMGAKTKCGENGASLVSVTSREEHQFISDWLATTNSMKEWYTSGRKIETVETDPDTGDINTPTVRFFWEGEGEDVEGFQAWLDEESRRDQNAEAIVYFKQGQDWGWRLVETSEMRPYICEISKNEKWRIVERARDHDYGRAETDSSLLERGPKFYRQPQNFIYDQDSVDDYTTLECIADGNPQPTYQWILQKERNPKIIDPLVENRYTLINGKLIIHDPSDTRDNGDYQCIATNRFGSILSSVAQLSFGYLLDFPKSQRDPVTVDAYAGVGIECNPPKHYPAILYSWYKDSILNFVRPNLKPYIFISNNGKLYFSQVTKDDEGAYFCLVFSPRAKVTASAGKVSTAINLVVQEAIASEREPQIASGFPVVFPSSPLRGDDVRIECFAWGTDELSYDWEREDDGKEMPPQAYKADWGRVLHIPNIQINDRGRYRCFVTRLNGQTSSGVVTLPVDATPFFSISLNDQFVDKQATMTWRCIANGIPPPTYSWYRNASLLTMNNLRPMDEGRLTISNNVLTLTDVRPEDSGMYQCAASNMHGTNFSAGQLKVLAFAPTFAKYPLQRTTYATLRGNVTIVCTPEAAPTATLEWRKNGRLLTLGNDMNSRMHRLGNGNLRIVGVNSGDAGNYTCIATNEFGTAQSAGQLSVLATTTITQYPRNTVVHVNSTAFLPCEASYNPLLDITYLWYHNDRKIEFEKVQHIGNEVHIYREPHFQRGSGINRGGLYVIEAQFYHEGRYTCVVEMSGSKLSNMATLQVMGPPSQPAGVFADGATATTMDVRWTAAPESSNGRPIKSFIVEAMNEWEGVWRQVKTNVRADSSKDQHETMVEGLMPFSSYFFRVRAVNSLGVGEPSSPSPGYTTRAAPPTKFPQNLGGGGGKVGDLTMNWDPIEKFEANGEGLGYKLYYKKKFLIDEEWTEAILNGRDHYRYVALVGSNNFYSQYDIKISAFNDEGEGPTSPVVSIWSAEDIPIGVPTNVRARPYNATALMVMWEPVPDTRETIKGVLLGYRINYWKEIGEDETMSIYRPLGGQRDSGIIIGLEAKTYYFVNVQVFNSAGNGPKSQDFLEETLRLAPKNQPTEVHVLVRNHNSVEVTWRGVSTDQTEEPLQGYMVRYWRQGETFEIGQEIDSRKKSHTIIENLEPDILYNLRVFGYSRGGEGLSSSPTIQFILGQDCAVLEASPEKRFIYTCGGSTVQTSSLLLAMLFIIHFVTTR